MNTHTYKWWYIPWWLKLLNLNICHPHLHLHTFTSTQILINWTINTISLSHIKMQDHRNIILTSVTSDNLHTIRMRVVPRVLLPSLNAREKRPLVKYMYSQRQKKWTKKRSTIAERELQNAKWIAKQTFWKRAATKKPHRQSSISLPSPILLNRTGILRLC